jgi:STE24 endopeptidase
MNEDKASRYHRLRRRLTIASVAVTAVVLVLLLVSGESFRIVWALSALASDAGWTGPLRFAAITASYAIVLAAALELATLPFAFAAWRLERRYELSVQGAGGWLTDQVKSFAITVALGAPATWMLYAIIHAWNEWWWLIAAAAFAVVMIVLARLVPTVLIPIFYECVPLARESLRDRLKALAARAGARVVDVFEWRIGTRTRRANAALVGLGGTRRILLSDTLLDQYSDDEIEVILAHEIAHHVHHDIWMGLGFETGVLVIALAFADAVVRATGPWVDIRLVGDPSGLPLILLAAGLVSALGMPVGNAISRRAERRADRFALDLTRMPDAFVTAMRRLGAQNLAEDRPSRVVEVVFHSHPPLPQRIAAAERWKTGD